MADETALATAPAPEATTSVSPASDAASTPPAATEASTPTLADPYALLADADPEELIRRFPKLQGKLGALAQRQASQQAAAIREEYERQKADELERQRIAYLRDLAKDDPESPLSQAVLKQAIEDERRRAEAERQQLNRQQWDAMTQQMAEGLNKQLTAVLEDPKVKEVWQSGDTETRRRLDFKSYDSHTAYVLGVASVLAEHDLQRQADKLAKAREKAADASDKVAEIKKTAERPDLGLGGAAPGTKIWTRSELRNIDPADWKTHKAEILRQQDEGLIRDE
jgi:hypothetical protein